MNELIWPWLVVGGLVVVVLSGTAAHSLQEVPWHELKAYARRRRRRERFDSIYEHAEIVLVGVDILQLAGVVILVAAWLLPAYTQPDPGNLLARWIGCLATLLIGVIWLPHAGAQLLAARYLFHTWWLWRTLTAALVPLAWGVELSKAVLRRLAGKHDPETEEEAFEDEILAMVAEGQHDGLLEPGAREMIEGVMELDDANVGDVMTPVSQMDLIPVDLPWDEMLKAAVELGHTRIPVYEGRRENIVGILYVKDLLAELAKEDAESRRPLRQLLRKAIHVPKSTRLDELLRRFLEERKHLFIVVDEFMNLAGLVTIEDVLEEIVGEIIDESDEEEEEEIQVVDDNCAIVLARAHVEAVNEELGIELPADQDFDTVGGFILRQLGRVPAAGESFLWNDVHVTILQSSPRRVEKAKLTVLAGAES